MSEAKSYSIVRRGPIIIVGIPLRTTNEGGKSGPDLKQHWDRFFREKVIDQIPHRKSDAPIGLYFDYEGDYTKPFSFIAGCEVSQVDNLPKGMVAKMVSPATYAYFSAEGVFPDCLIKTWQTVWLTPLKRSYIADLEVYSDEPLDPQHAELDLMIGIKA